MYAIKCTINKHVKHEGINNLNCNDLKEHMQCQGRKEEIVNIFTHLEWQDLGNMGGSDTGSPRHSLGTGDVSLWDREQAVVMFFSCQKTSCKQHKVSFATRGGLLLSVELSLTGPLQSLEALMVFYTTGYVVFRVSAPCSGVFENQAGLFYHLVS